MTLEDVLATIPPDEAERMRRELAELEAQLGPMLTEQRTTTIPPASD